MQWMFRGIGALPLRAAHAVGGLVGAIAARLPIRLREVAQINLRIAFPDLDPGGRRQLLRACLTHQGRSMMELGFLMSRPKGRVLELVREVHGEDELRKAIESKRGVILGGIHLGAWELVLAYCSDRYPMTTLFRAPRPRELGPWLRAARQRFGTRMTPPDANAARMLLKALRQGEMVGIAPDQDAGDGAGIFVPLFGKLANTTMLPSRLAAKTGALFVLAYAERLPCGGGFRLHIVPVSPEVYESDIQRSVTALNRDIEDCIRKVPEQWLWAYKRYRIRPVGLASPYDGKVTRVRR